MPNLGYLATQAPYCLGGPVVTPSGTGIHPAQPACAARNAQRGYPLGIHPAQPACAARNAQRGSPLATQLIAMATAAIIWAVFSSATSSPIPAHRSNDTSQ